MAYSNSRGRSRAARNPDPSSPHVPIMAFTAVAAVAMTVFRLPGMAVLASGLFCAAKSARPPLMAGKDVFKRPAPQGRKDERRYISYRKAKLWFQSFADLSPTGPVFPAALGAGLLAGAMQRTFLCGLLQTLGTAVCLMAWWARSGRTYGEPHAARRDVPWARKQVRPVLLWTSCAAAAGLMLWAVCDSIALGLALPCLAAPAAMIPALRAARRQFERDRAAAGLICGWIEQADQPPAKTPPVRVTGTKRGRAGEWLFVLEVAQTREWVAQTARDALSPQAGRAGLEPSFVLDGRPGHVIASLTPLDEPDGATIAADPTGLEARCDAETARLGFNYATFPGSSHLVQVGERDGRPAAFAWSLKGPQPDWTRVRADWLRGSHDGRLGDWGTLIDLNMLVDPAFDHGWVWAGDRDSIDFDDRAAGRWRTAAFSATTDTKRYLDLVERNEADIDTWQNALDGHRLPVPVSFAYDMEETLEADGWAVTVLPLGVDQRGGYSAMDYMKIDLRPAMGDSTVADIVAMPNPAGGMFTRWMRLVVSSPSVNPSMPTSLDGLAGSGQAEALLAQTLATRAFATALKHPALVGQPRQMLRHGSLWRIPVQLTGGVTAADARRAQPALQSLMGATVALWQWMDASHVVLWAGAERPAGRDAWASQRDWQSATRLAMSDAWATAKAVTRDGRTLETLDFRPDAGDLWRAEFRIPQGLSREAVEERADEFAQYAGFAFAKVVPGDGSDMLAMLLCDHDPLPPLARPDWNLLDPKGRDLPFGVLADGSTAWWRPARTPHLLASGATRSGKSSVSMTLVEGALRRGWTVCVADPSKGANDFKPIESKLSAFCPDLATTVALFDWAVSEMKRRKRLVARYASGDLLHLPADVRPDPVFIQIDEFNSLLSRAARPLANPNGDPEIDNANARTGWETGQRVRIAKDIADIATQGGSNGMMLLLAAQQLHAGDMDAMGGQASTVRAQLGRVFLGSGEAAGNVTGGHLREAHRLIANATANGAMPKGRGVYEELGGDLNMMQCWFSGTSDEYARECADLPDRTPIDLKPFMPAPPRRIGVMDEPAAEATVTADAGDDEWVL